eukprot:531919-Amphidinium_carterae.1
MAVEKVKKALTIQTCANNTPQLSLERSLQGKFLHAEHKLLHPTVCLYKVARMVGLLIRPHGTLALWGLPGLTPFDSFKDAQTCDSYAHPVATELRYLQQAMLALVTTLDILSNSVPSASTSVREAKQEGATGCGFPRPATA